MTSVGSAFVEPAGGLVCLDGIWHYRIEHPEAMPPFFMSLVSDSDHWMFLSSTGALTAGRRDPDHALFPYYTDDRIHDSQDQVGSKTLLQVSRGGRTQLWEPFSQRGEGRFRVTRSLCKSVLGNRILFEEENHDLGLTFRYAWMNSERFGFVRRAWLSNQGGSEVEVTLLDGLENLLPWGVERRFQAEYSTLADGYKRTELVPGSSLALYRLSSVPVDRPEPSEALRVNLAWSWGLAPDLHLLSTTQLRAFRLGQALLPETDVRGQRGAYLLHSHLGLAPGESRDWLVVAEVNQDAPAVVALRRRLAEDRDLGAGVLADVAEGSRNLQRLLGAVDGFQTTGDALQAQRHLSNTLFNILRGGLPADGYRITRADFLGYLERCNREVLQRHAGVLGAWPETLEHAELGARAEALGDPDLARLAREYLPLTFSRRHGDPSRPWNSFSIQVKDPEGRRVLGYEGNWRDIFQNWEALGHAFPGYLEGMVSKFLDCSTVDGYNPYRLMREGFDWEVDDPQDPWSFIGYWGDHQVIYLLKLLEGMQRFQPGRLAELLDQRRFAYAQVPYRLKSYTDMLADPHSTIVFDEALHQAVLERASRLGTDGLLVPGGDGPVRATLAEKLLVVALSKLSAFVSGGGIWMNTQRPEWNDANNALVGFGVSTVTACYLRRYLAFCRKLFADPGGGPLELSEELASHFNRVSDALQTHLPEAGRPVSPAQRRQLLDELGEAGADYRRSVYGAGFSGARTHLGRAQLDAFCEIALHHLDHTIQASRRPDGLYHAYQVMAVHEGRVDLRPLTEMLEGQVAVLSSGALAPSACADVLDALAASALYRPDQASYLLYPDTPLPTFLEKNRVPAPLIEGSPLLQAHLATGDTRLVVRDAEGQVRFHADFRNAARVRQALVGLASGPEGDRVAAETARILEIYEAVFDHQSFTGRSGTFYKYEGLGCIYWHMVSKLLLAVEEVLRLTDEGDPARAHLSAHAQAIRDGLGVHKPPALHGAIPTDPYSHTTGFAGAQQPGMTGQVKEDILSRLAELGLEVADGALRFHGWRVPEVEFLSAPAPFAWVGLDGRLRRLDLAAGSLAFTFCQVPIILHRSAPVGITVVWGEGEEPASHPGLTLDAVTSAHLFQRDGVIQRLEVGLGRA